MPLSFQPIKGKTSDAFKESIRLFLKHLEHPQKNELHPSLNAGQLAIMVDVTRSANCLWSQSRKRIAQRLAPAKVCVQSQPAIALEIAIVHRQSLCELSVGSLLNERKQLVKLGRACSNSSPFHRELLVGSICQRTQTKGLIAPCLQQ